MKKILLLLGIVYSSCVWGQNVPKNLNVGELAVDTTFDQDFFSFLDMKVFNDPQMVQEMMMMLYDKRKDMKSDEKITSAIFNEEDSNLLEKTLSSREITYDITPEMLEKSAELPSAAYKDMIKSVHIPQITREEMKKLNKVDKKAIPKMKQMITESGPDIGSSGVSVMYDEI